MNYIRINKSSVTEGPGIRLTLFVSGCRNHCPGCHNSDTWCFAAGEPFTEDTLGFILYHLSKPYIAGLSICGGEPFEPENQEGLVPLLRAVHRAFPEKPVWCYTGYEWEDLLEGGRKHTPDTAEFLSYMQALVAGPYKQEQRDITDSNRWRGSRNQRVLDVQKSLSSGFPVAFAGVPNNEVKKAEDR